MAAAFSHIRTTLLGKTVGIITGAGSGIGASAVETFAAAGAQTIYATDMLDKGLLGHADDLKAKGYDCLVVPVTVDVTKAEQVEALVRKVIKESGRLDWMFANAGIVDFENLNTTTPQILNKMLDVNVVGAFNSIFWGSRGMMNTSADKPSPGGSIVVTTSVASTFGGMGATSYTVSKHAAVGLVRSAASQLKMAGTGIRVNGVGPGPTSTQIGTAAMATASKQAIEGMMARAHFTEEQNKAAAEALSPPEYIAQTAVFLASRFSAGVNGENIIADKGLRQMPDPLGGVVFMPVFEPIEVEAEGEAAAKPEAENQ